jgi:hypothetical protein
MSDRDRDAKQAAGNDGAAATNKRMKLQGPLVNSSPAPFAKVNCLNVLDDGCRLKILSFLSWKDLGRASATSKAFREDCRHPSLTQNADRQRVLLVGECPLRFLSLLARGARLNQFATYPKLKIVRGVRFEYFSRSDLREPRFTIPGITSLEVAFDTASDVDARRPALGSRVPLWFWEATAECLPNLRHLTVSDERGNGMAPVKVAETCPRLETLTFHRQSSTYLLRGLGHAQQLRAVYMDDCTFRIDAGAELVLVDDGRSSRCIFDGIVDQLERLSLRNARYYYMDNLSNVRDIPQSVIITFVRRAANLTWLRSDLTPENVAMLQRERPNVSFVQ